MTGRHALVLACVVACAAPPPAATATGQGDRAKAGTACDRVRERLESLERTGRVERLLAATSAATAECPSLAHRAHVLRAAAASALGACEDAKGAAHALETSGAPAEDRARGRAAAEACATPKDGEDALVQALVMKERGDLAAARRLFDRAARAFATRTTHPLSIETTTSPNTSMYPRATFSPDGRWVVGAVGHRLTIVDTVARRRVLSLACDDNATATFGDAFVAVLGCEGAPGEEAGIRDRRQRLFVFHLPDGRQVDLDALTHATAVAAAGSLVAIADDATITVAAGASGATRWKMRTPVVPNGALAMAFDPKGSRLAVRDASGVLGIFATADARLLRKLPARKTPYAEPLIFSPDGEVLVDLGSDGAPTAWSVATGAGRPLTSAPKTANVLFSRDGREATFWANDRSVTFDISTGKKLRDRAQAGRTLASLVETRAGWFALEQDASGALERVDLGSGARSSIGAARRDGQDTLGAALSADATRWAYVSGSEYFEGNPLHVGSTSEAEVTYPSHVEMQQVRAPILAGDASLLALSRRDSVVLMELPTGHIARRWPAKDPSALAFSPKHDALAIVTETVDVVETRDGSLRFRISGLYRPMLAWGRDALALTESSTGPIRIVDPMTGGTQRTLPLAPGASVSALDFEPDGTLVVDLYGGALAVRLDDPNAVLSPRAPKDRLLARCPKVSTRLPEWLRRDQRSIVSVSNDCRVALRTRDREVVLHRLPEADRALVLELAHEHEELFFRAATTTHDDGENATTRRYMHAGDLVFGDVIQLVGARARDLVTCRIGPRVLPTEVCEERLFDQDLVERFLAAARP